MTDEQHTKSVMGYVAGSSFEDHHGHFRQGVCGKSSPNRHAQVGSEMIHVQHFADKCVEWDDYERVGL